MVSNEPVGPSCPKARGKRIPAATSNLWNSDRMLQIITQAGRESSSEDRGESQHEAGRKTGGHHRRKFGDWPGNSPARLSSVARLNHDPCGNGMETISAQHDHVVARKIVRPDEVHASTNRSSPMLKFGDRRKVNHVISASLPRRRIRFFIRGKCSQLRPVRPAMVAVRSRRLTGLERCI
jgi:hypothetical protein